MTARPLIALGLCLIGCGGGGASGTPKGAAAPPGAPTSPSAPPPAVVAVPEPETLQAAEPEEEAPDVGPISADGGWSTFHANAARHGAVDAPVILRPRIRWRSRVGVQSWLNGPLALGKVAVVPSCGTRHNMPDPGDGLHALDMKTGRRIWQARMGGDANGALATGERVIATSDDGHVYAFELSSGKQAWKQKGEGKMYTHPLRFGDRVVVGDASGFVRAFAIADGRPLWSLQLTGAIRGGAAADERRLYVVSQGGEAAALGADGKALWRVQVERPSWDGRGRPAPIEAYSPPIVTRDLVIVPFARDTYYQDQPGILALDKRNGKVRWRAKGPGQWGNVRSTPVLVVGRLIWGEPYSGDVAALDADTGRSSYRHTIGPCYFPQWASPAAAGDVVYLPRFDGAVYALRAASGKRLWELYLGDERQAGKPRPAAPPSRYGCEWDVPHGHPLYSPAAVAEDGTLLVGSGEGFVYAIEGA